MLVPAHPSTFWCAAALEVRSVYRVLFACFHEFYPNIKTTPERQLGHHNGPGEFLPMLLFLPFSITAESPASFLLFRKSSGDLLVFIMAFSGILCDPRFDLLA